MSEDELAQRITRAEQRRERARRERRSSLWTQVARVGTLGWLIVLPIVAGALLGHLLDRRFDTGVTWALALMFVGLAGSAYLLWAELRKRV